MNPHIDFSEDIVFLNVSRLYRAGMTGQEVYDITRRAWRVAPCRQARAQVALGVARGIIVSAYATEGWQPCAAPFEDKSEFKQKNDASVRRYVGHSAEPFMLKGARYVVRYNFDC